MLFRSRTERLLSLLGCTANPLRDCRHRKGLRIKNSFVYNQGCSVELTIMTNKSLSLSLCVCVCVLCVINVSTVSRDLFELRPAFVRRRRVNFFACSPSPRSVSSVNVLKSDCGVWLAIRRNRGARKTMPGVRSGEKRKRSGGRKSSRNRGIADEGPGGGAAAGLANASVGTDVHQQCSSLAVSLPPPAPVSSQRGKMRFGSRIDMAHNRSDGNFSTRFRRN